MKIKGHESEQMILKEIGRRARQYRIALNITQNDLADRCGVSTSTVARIENGEDTKISNHIKVLYALNLLENLDVLIPEPQQDFKALFDQKPMRQRVRQSKNEDLSEWIWEEDR